MPYQPKTYRKQGGDEFVVASGGRINVEDGGFIRNNLPLATIATAGAETYTAAQLKGVIARDPAGAARTDTTDTAANIISTLKLDSDGETAEATLINTADAAETITLAGGTGVTVANAGQTVAQNKSARLIFRRTSATAVTLYIVGA